MTNTTDLTWIDQFITNVRPYIFVRTEDNVLIKRPNQAQKVNASGARLLKSLLDGQTVGHILQSVGDNEVKRADILRFMVAVKQFMEGSLNAFTDNPAVEKSLFDMRFSTLPVLSEIALTYRCNLRCAFCYAGCNCTRNGRDSSELTTSQAKRILDVLFHEAQVPSVSFTGGEPTLVRALPELISHAKKLGMRVNLITNGTLIGSRMSRVLADSGLDSAQVSIEGITAQSHDALVGSAGAFERSVAAVGHLHALGIRVHSNTTITARNIDDCVAMPGFVQETLAMPRFSMNMVIPTGSSAVNDGIMMRYSEVGAVLDRIMAESRAHNVEFMWYSPVPMCMFNSIANGLGNKGCSACDGLVSISPRGEVLPCASYDQPVGSLLTQPFRDVWASASAVRFREKGLAHPDCRVCGDFALCHGACPLYWQHVGYEELERVRGGKCGVRSAEFGVKSVDDEHVET